LTAYSLALYLPFRSGTFPSPAPGEWWPLDWTHPVDATRFRAHVGAEQYKKLLWAKHDVVLAGNSFRMTWFAQPFAQTLPKLQYFLGMFALQYFWCTPALLLGALVVWKKHNGGAWLGGFLASIFVLNIGVHIHYNVGDQANFFFPAYIAMAVWMGVGLAWLLRTALKWAGDDEKKRWRARTLITLSIAGCWLLQLGMAYPLASQRGKTIARDTAVERAKVVEKLAAASGKTPHVVLLADDALWGFWYAKFVLGRAPQSTTPWGPKRNDARKSGRLADLVADWQRSGPVVLGQWDQSTDHRFPLTMLSPRGDLWLASRRILPEPAAILPRKSTTEKQRTTEKSGFIRAAVLGRRPSASGTVSAKRSDLLALDVDLQLENASGLTPGETGAPVIDAVNKTAHVGYIQILLVKPGSLKTPPPSQGQLQKSGGVSAPLLVSKQTRRLVIPQNAKRGDLLRMRVPLQLEHEASLGLHQMWIRITRTRDDRQTSWRRSLGIQFTES
ncbi:MAG TPA: hypothetical protein VF719_09215, partial [Abditibacteriaceae bacterium]